MRPRRSACMVRHARACRFWQIGEAAAHRVLAPAKSPDLRLRPATRRALPAGNSGAICLNDRPNHNSRRHHSPRLRARRERHVARVPARHNSRAARRAMHRALREVFGLARFALHLRIHDSAALARRDCRLEFVARLRRDRLECHRRLLPFRESAVARRHRPRSIRRAVGTGRHGRVASGSPGAM